jgi:methylated-DNA-[protein]-cysteine S-methyltransferase
MSPTCHVTTFATPCGPFSVAVSAPANPTTTPTSTFTNATAVNPTAAVIATAFGDLAKLRTRLPEKCNPIGYTTPLTLEVEKQVVAYFAGKLRAFSVPLAAEGTAFQQRVWAALGAIPFGETRSYGQLAAALGQPGAARAIGRANATNPICLLVPCHRVIGADGSLTGFAFGEAIKRQLLQHEGAPCTEKSDTASVSFGL